MSLSKLNHLPAGITYWIDQVYPLLFLSVENYWLAKAADSSAKAADNSAKTADNSAKAADNLLRLTPSKILPIQTLTVYIAMIIEDIKNVIEL